MLPIWWAGLPPASWVKPGSQQGPRWVSESPELTRGLIIARGSRTSPRTPSCLSRGTRAKT